MKVRTFTKSFLQLNTYLAYILPNRSRQSVSLLSKDKVKEIIYHAMPNTWKKKIVEQVYNYLNGSIQSMAEFFEARVEKLEKFDNKKDNNKG